MSVQTDYMLIIMNIIIFWLFNNIHIGNSAKLTGSNWEITDYYGITDDELHCTDNVNCVLRCYGEYSCGSSIIYGPTDATLTIYCDSSKYATTLGGGCYYLDIDAFDSTALTVYVYNGENEFRGTNIWAPNNGAGGGITTNIECGLLSTYSPEPKDTVCGWNTKIYAVEGWNDVRWTYFGSNSWALIEDYAYQYMYCGEGLISDHTDTSSYDYYCAYWAVSSDEYGCKTFGQCDDYKIPTPQPTNSPTTSDPSQTPTAPTPIPSGSPTIPTTVPTAAPTETAVLSTVPTATPTVNDNCKAIYFGYPYAFPTIALDVCLIADNDGIQTASKLICNDARVVMTQVWTDSSECNGIPNDESYFTEGDYVECDGIECDYAIVRMYDSTSCEQEGDFAELAIIVHTCTQIKDCNVYSDCYAKYGCNPDDSYWNADTLNYTTHSNSDCSSDHGIYQTLYVDGKCDDNGNSWEVTCPDAAFTYSLIYVAAGMLFIPMLILLN